MRKSTTSRIYQPVYAYFQFKILKAFLERKFTMSARTRTRTAYFPTVRLTVRIKEKHGAKYDLDVVTLHQPACNTLQKMEPYL
jgi:hypothetical protein